jgi:hypothetical protein
MRRAGFSRTTSGRSRQQIIVRGAAGYPISESILRFAWAAFHHSMPLVLKVRLPFLVVAGVAATACGASTDEIVATSLPLDGAALEVDAGRDAAADRASAPDVTADRRAWPDAAVEAAPDAPVVDVSLPDAAAAPLDAAGGAAPCTEDDDCRLVDDCCSCLAVAHEAAGPACDPKKSCPTTTCAQYGGVERARCVAGRCIVGFECATGPVTCNRQPPFCPRGQTPLAVGPADDRCYGECVDAAQCLAVPGCAACAAGDLCMRTPGTDQLFHCLPRPAGCAPGAPTCACAAPACIPPYGTCADADAGGIVCDLP